MFQRGLLSHQAHIVTACEVYRRSHTDNVHWRLGFCLADKQVYLKNVKNKVCLECLINFLVVEFNLSRVGKDHKQINAASERTQHKLCLRAKSYYYYLFSIVSITCSKINLSQSNSLFTESLVPIAQRTRKTFLHLASSNQIGWLYWTYKG